MRFEITKQQRNVTSSNCHTNEGKNDMMKAMGARSTETAATNKNRYRASRPSNKNRNQLTTSVSQELNEKKQI